MISLWLFLAFDLLGISRAALEVKSFNCEVAEETGTSESLAFDLHTSCGGATNLSVSLNNKIVGEISKQEVTLILSSLSPLLGVSQVNGVDPFIKVIGTQQLPSDFDIGVSSVIALETQQATFPPECGTYFLIAVLKVEGAEGESTSSDYAVINRRCEDEKVADLSLLLTEESDASPSLKTDKEGKLLVAGLSVAVSVDSSSAVPLSARTALAAPVLSASLWTLSPSAQITDFTPTPDTQKTWKSISDSLVNYYGNRTDEVRLSGLESALVSDNKGIGIAVGAEEPIDISLLKIPKLQCTKRSSFFILRLYVDPGERIPDANRDNNVIDLPLLDCSLLNWNTSIFTQKKMPSCEIIPGTGNDAADAIIKSNFKTFMYNGKKKGFEALSQGDSARHMEYFIHEAEVMEKASRLMSLNVCPNPPVDDDLKQALKDSLVSRASGLVTDLRTQVEAITAQSDASNADHATLVSILSVAEAAVSAYLVPANQELRQFILQLIPVRRILEGEFGTERTGGGGQGGQGGQQSQDGQGGQQSQGGQGGQQSQGSEQEIAFPIKKMIDRLGEVCVRWCVGAFPCLKKKMVCDGTRQCRDGSDEMECGTRNTTSEWRTEALLRASGRRNPNKGNNNNNKNVDSSIQIESTFNSGVNPEKENTKDDSGKVDTNLNNLPGGTLPNSKPASIPTNSVPDPNNPSANAPNPEPASTPTNLGPETNNPPRTIQNPQSASIPTNSVQNPQPASIPTNSVQNPQPASTPTNSAPNSNNQPRNIQYPETASIPENLMPDPNNPLSNSLNLELPSFPSNQGQPDLSILVNYEAPKLPSVPSSSVQGFGIPSVYSEDPTPSVSSSPKKKPDEFGEKQNKNSRRNGKDRQRQRRSRKSSEAEREILRVGMKLYFRLLTVSSPEEMPEFDFIPTSLRQELIDFAKSFEIRDPIFSFIEPWRVFIDQDMKNGSLFNKPYIRMVMSIAGTLKWMSPSSLLGLEAMVKELIVYAKDDLGAKAIAHFEGDAEMTVRVKYSLALIDIILNNLGTATEVAKQAMTMMLDKGETNVIEQQPGKEPILEAYCRRAAGQNVDAVDMKMKETNAPTSPFFDFMNQISTKMNKRPVTWMQYKGGIYRGERSGILGVTYWEKVAVCYCDNFKSKDDDHQGTRTGNSNRPNEGRFANRGSERNKEKNKGRNFMTNFTLGLNAGDSEAHRVVSENDNETVNEVGEGLSARSFKRNNEWQGFGLPVVPAPADEEDEVSDPEEESHTDTDQYEGFGLEHVYPVPDVTERFKAISFPGISESLFNIFGVEIKDSE